MPETDSEALRFILMEVQSLTRVGMNTRMSEPPSVMNWQTRWTQNPEMTDFIR